MTLELERFIDKPFKALLSFGKVDEVEGVFEGALPELKKQKTVVLNTKVKFCKLNYSRLHIVLDDKEFIKELSTGFRGIVGRTFFDELISCYGNPNNILAFDKLITDSKSEHIEADTFSFNASKRVYTMKEVSFNEKPIFILWKRAHFDIKLMFHYKENATQLTFRTPKEDLF